MGINNDENYTYIDLNFESTNGKVYEMEYILPSDVTKDDLQLQEGSTYELTFEVEEGTLHFEYNIKEIK